LVVDNSEREGELVAFTDRDTDAILDDIEDRLSKPLDEYPENEPIAKILIEFIPDENPRDDRGRWDYATEGHPQTRILEIQMLGKK
jgi:hypothetical protein